VLWLTPTSAVAVGLDLLDALDALDMTNFAASNYKKRSSHRGATVSVWR
tara:strand:- start:1046 stop:1192 length:147 start_codon:yes stop_codon:yes gene_type:complete